MLLGALIDLGVTLDKIMKCASVAAASLPGCDHVSIRATTVRRYGIRAIKVTVEANEHYEHRNGKTLLRTIKKMLDAANVSNQARKLAFDALRNICTTEGALHSEKPEEVDLHELGSIDTVVDIGGVAIALDELGLFEKTAVYSLPVNVGAGCTRTSHGILSSPTMDTLEILRCHKFPFEIGTSGSELATPTGVAILTAIARPVEPGYAIRPLSVGYGAGSKHLDFAPNILRIVVGEKPTHDSSHDEVSLLETNLDDVDGETIGYVMDKLMREGARDVWTTPIMAKKNRPGVVLHAMVDNESVAHLTRLIFAETGTLGIRVSRIHRQILARTTHNMPVIIAGKKFQLSVKVASDTNGKIVQAKPEHDEIRKIAESINLPLRTVALEARKQIDSSLQGKK